MPPAISGSPAAASDHTLYLSQCRRNREEQSLSQRLIASCPCHVWELRDIVNLLEYLALKAA
jgi:hypothetical protein